MSAFDEKLLIEKIIRKDESALRTLVDHYTTRVHSFVMKQINNKQEADEVVQDTFMDFIEGVRTFRGESSIATYLISIARNKTIDFIRKKKIKTLAFSALSPYVVESLQRIFLDEELDKNELKEKIHQTLTQLPNDYQIILRLKYIEGRKMREIAAILSMKFKAAESLLMRARRAFVAVYVNA